MLTLNDGRSELWQWDTGRTLAVDADCSQVHFSNKVFGRSIDVDVVDGAAIIPDILLQTDKDLNVWAFVGTAENGYTKISKTFKVNRRNKPADYVFTPPEQTSLEEIKERLEYLEQNPVEVPVQSVNGKTGTVELTAEDVGAIAENELHTAINTALAQAKASGEFDGADGADGKSAYACAVDGGYTGTEDEFAAKLAEKMPDALPNPNPLTFTGAVTGSYDGSEALAIEIPSSGGEIPKPLTYDYMPDGYPKKSVLFDIEWDGDTSGLVSVAGAYYKVADYTAVTKADLVGCMLSLQNDPEHPEPFAVEKNVIVDSLIPHAIAVSDYAIFVSEPTSHGKYNFPESGIYFVKMGELYIARLVKQTITPMAEEFIPTMNVSAFTNDAGYITTDQLSDVVSVADIVDNLTTNVANKPLSAAQGVTLKALIDGISVPDKLPNPNALTFTGAATGSYDGSEALTVEIPSGGSSVPKPLTYDYMPEGYPTKVLETTTLMEEQELAFAFVGDGEELYGGSPSSPLAIEEGRTYAINWDGTEYECVGFVSDGVEIKLGNLSISGHGDDTGEPFLYVWNPDGPIAIFFTLDASATHTIGVKGIDELAIPMAEEFIPTTAKLPNPNALTFTGAVTGSYDGSAPLSVEIPSGGGGGAWHTIGTQKMDGVETAVSFDLNGETIIQIIVTANWSGALTATKATVTLTFESGETVEFTPQTMNATSYSPKNIFTIFGNSKHCRQMIFSKAEGAQYSNVQGSFGVAYGYDYNSEYMVEDGIATGITITFEQAPSNDAIVKVEGM